MSFAYYSAMYQLELSMTEQIRSQIGQRIESADMYAALINIINDKVNSNQFDRQMITALRLTLKLNPYSPQTTELSNLYFKIMRAYVTQRFPALMATVQACRAKNLPLPVIISCAKYLDGGIKLQQDMTAHYFGITPIIVRGDTKATEAQFENSILTLPVDDTYEGVPLKMMELYAFIANLDERVGVLKIDDDIVVHPGSALDLQKVTGLFTLNDYMGVAAGNPAHDRMWHHGKCVQPTPFSYGKPLKAPWARGALYYLSPYALTSLATYYLRFPGQLEGEIYEDKMVGDMLYDNNIRLYPFTLEHILALDTTSPFR